MHVPPFGASIHFELYRNGRGEYYVQLFYRTDDSEYMAPIEIPNCGTKCPLDKLHELFKDILPTEDETYASLCHLDDRKTSVENNELLDETIFF